MTTTQMQAMFYRIIDDESVDQDLVLDFLNLAKDELTLERDWIWLIQHDTSITWATSDTYLTQHSLPSGFLRHIRAYANGLLHPLVEAPWEDRERIKDLSNRVMYDYLNSKIHFSGTTSQSRAITLAYIKDIGDMDYASVTSPTGWPTALHKMFPIKAAELYLGGTDADNVSKQMASQFIKEYFILHRLAVNMDAKLRGRVRNFSSAQLNPNYDSHPDIVTEL